MVDVGGKEETKRGGHRKGQYLYEPGVPENGERGFYEKRRCSGRGRVAGIMGPREPLS